ncbi:adenylyltransferase and sulfurtransferase UBA4-like [Dendronephthya gigantea]|uniref:adenylyltransferase and sulfurtransferase UBA4-like n=1 Tax=Dendronephthya gigantea TaxID=151771 RepID=UPI001069E7B8|nr:adenylyltransferase and sulfurtransferase UBA4-like [Dendronephthya gigantea]
MADSISMRVALFGIRKTFPNVKQLQTKDLDEFIVGNKYKNLILLDVREQDEYEVSHLPNAIRVEPDEAVDQVMTKIKEKLEDISNYHVRVVCYCSVGYRSSAMAQKLYRQFRRLIETEQIDIVSKIYNLEGGIFKWANEGMELIDCNNQETKYCHPYNFLWGKLLNAQLRISEPTKQLAQNC